MITATLLAVLGVVLVIVLVAMFKGPKAVPPPAKTPGQVSATVDAHPWNARRGDVVSIRGAADDFSDLDFTVDRRSAYESSNRRWVDLSGEYRGRRVYLEVMGRTEPDAMGILDGRKLSLPDVQLTEQQLADMDSRQDANAFIQYENKRWYFDSSREIGYFENEGQQGEGLYRWLFREQNGDRLISIEKWEGEPFEARIAKRLNTQDITVFKAS
ncbi:MAG: DUF4178 domain-containing protein [Acidobacteria bacterium]|nr:DUF4178 domain-containing protein [Acidobacteriota bacterium]